MLLALRDNSTTEVVLEQALPDLLNRWSKLHRQAQSSAGVELVLHRRRRSEQGPFPAHVLKRGHGLDEAQLAVALRETTIFVSSVFTQHRLRKGCPCQDLLQPCGHEEAVDSSLEIFNLQSFILALALPGGQTH